MGYFTPVPDTDITVDDYTESVRDQVVNVFASTGARDSAITDPVVGMVVYIKSNDANEGYYTYTSANVWIKLSWNQPWGRVGAAQVYAPQTGITSVADLSGLSVTFTAVANRIRKITGIAQLFSTTAADQLSITIVRGSTVLSYGSIVNPSTSLAMTVTAVIEDGAASGSTTYKLQASRSGAGSMTMNAGAAYPAMILVEDIGPAGAPA